MLDRLVQGVGTPATNCCWIGETRRASTAARFESSIGRSETTGGSLSLAGESERARQYARRACIHGKSLARPRQSRHRSDAPIDAPLYARRDLEPGRDMPAKGVIHHVDLAVSDVERSLAFYLDLLGPLGWKVTRRYPTYRGTEEVVYLGTGDTNAVRQRPRAGPSDCDRPMAALTSTTASVSSTLPSRWRPRTRLMRRMPVRRPPARRSTSRRKRTATSRATTRSSRSTPTASGSKCSPGRQCRDKEPALSS